MRFWYTTLINTALARLFTASFGLLSVELSLNVMASENTRITSKQFVEIFKRFDKDGKDAR